MDNNGNVTLQPATQWIQIARHGKYAMTGISEVYYHFKASDVYEFLEKNGEIEMLKSLKQNHHNGLIGWSTSDIFYRRGLQVYEKPYTAKSNSDYEKIESEVYKDDMDAISD